MKKIIISLVILVIAALAAFFYGNKAAEMPVQRESSAQEYKSVLGLDDTFIFNGVSLTAWAVTEDSRCPSDVQCIQAGRVTVALRISSATGTSSISEISPGKTTTFDNVSITLDEVSPYPISTHKTTDGEYRFSFTFKKE